MMRFNIWKVLGMFLGIAVLGFYIGTRLPSLDIKGINYADTSSRDEEIRDPRTDTIYKFLDELGTAIADKDISKLNAMMVGDGLEINKEDLQQFVEPFASNNKIKEFIMTLKDQTIGYLEGEPSKDLFFYLDDRDSKLKVVVNAIELELLVRSETEEITVTINETKEKTVKIPKDSNTAVISGLMPCNMKIDASIKEYKDTINVNTIKYFINPETRKGSELTIRELIFKRGAGVRAVIHTNGDGAKLFINGKETDIILSSSESTIVDQLKLGDTLRANLDGEMSNDFKLREGEFTAELNFKPKEELRFGLPKLIIDNLETHTTNFLNSLVNGVSSKDASQVLGQIEPHSQTDAMTKMNRLVSSYSSILFTGVSITNVVQQGEYYDVYVNVTVDGIDLFGGSVLAPGSIVIRMGANGLVNNFNI